MTRMERKQRRVNIAVNVLIIIGCVVCLLIATATMFETVSAYKQSIEIQKTIDYAHRVNEECEVFLKEVAACRD